MYFFPFSIQAEPVMNLKETSNGLKFTGFFGEVWHEVAQKLNLQYEINFKNTEEYGTDVGNGSFGGMIGMVQRNEYDMAIAHFYYTKSRNRVVDFCKPIYTSK